MFSQVPAFQQKKSACPHFYTHTHTHLDCGCSFDTHNFSIIHKGNKTMHNCVPCTDFFFLAQGMRKQTAGETLSKTYFLILHLSEKSKFILAISSCTDITPALRQGPSAAFKLWRCSGTGNMKACNYSQIQKVRK